VAKGGSSFAIFGLCAGLSELQMCLHLRIWFNFNFLSLSIMKNSFKEVNGKKKNGK